jgi:hypothetical protein
MRDTTRADPATEPPKSEATETEPTRVFRLLSDETRLAIVTALADASEPVCFSALRDRVGAADSGRFNYHLGELRETLVTKRADGYALTPAGERAVHGLSVVPDA